MTAKVDLHVHSKHSNRPSEWILRQFGAPESFTEPKEIYRLAKERGMRFVTISDHDTIDGALEILHLPDTFASCEVTVEFPEDRCEIHCLVVGIDERQQRDIQELRRNVYELRDYLVTEGIVHSVAHPLFRVNDKLTLAQVEKLLVLFNRFEARNGIHDRRANELVERIFGGLSREVIEELAERHRLTPAGPTPWRKSFTGGSDDHGGFYIATTYTETPEAASVAEYLAHLSAGDHRPGGDMGSSLRLAQSLYAIAHEFYRRQFPFGLGSRKDPFSELLRSLASGVAEPGAPAAPKKGLRERLQAFSSRPGRKAAAQTESDLTAAGPRTAAGPSETVDRTTFGSANRATQELVTALLSGFFRNARRGRLAESLAAAAVQLAPLGIAIAPYLVSLHAQHKDADLLEQAALRFLGRNPEEAAGLRGKKAWFTDTLTDVNGVAKTVRTLADLARERGLQLVAVTCGRETPPGDLAVKVFQPMAELAIPGYESQKVTLPPLLEVLEHCERERYSEILISTPGPLGLLGLLAGKLLGIPTTGIYHTDFPLYVRHLLGSPALEEMTWSYMRWFFGQMDQVYVASRSYHDLLAAHGVDPKRLALLPRGVDAAFFHPERRDPAFFRRFGLPQGFKILYVGRVSREKNLDALLLAFTQLQKTGRPAQLVVVGDGPHLKSLARRYRHPDILFTGFLHGQELAKAYASCDLFVFPSTTDTFGNVVLEAQASGLPAVVSDRGGPQEIVLPHRSGIAVDVDRPGELLRAICGLYDDPELRAAMGRRAVEQARSRSWEQLLERLWGGGAAAAPRRTDVQLLPAAAALLSAREGAAQG